MLLKDYKISIQSSFPVMMSSIVIILHLLSTFLTSLVAYSSKKIRVSKEAKMKKEDVK